jgi:hypothetical protein
MATAYSKLTHELVKEYFYYDEHTGVLTWKKSHRSALIGKEASQPRKDGYRHVHFKSSSHLAHRLIWLFVHGNHASNFIDHINHDRADNRIANLRLVSRKQNNENKSKSEGKSSKFKGVTFRKDQQKWTAQICTNYKQKHLGYFESEELAHVAYLKAAEELHTCNNK